jgi:hypothetical protein
LPTLEQSLHQILTQEFQDFGVYEELSDPEAPGASVALSSNSTEYLTWQVHAGSIVLRVVNFTGQEIAQVLLSFLTGATTVKQLRLSGITHLLNNDYREGLFGRHVKLLVRALKALLTSAGYTGNIDESLRVWLAPLYNRTLPDPGKGQEGDSYYEAETGNNLPYYAVYHRGKFFPVVNQKDAALAVLELRKNPGRNLIEVVGDIARKALDEP